MDQPKIERVLKLMMILTDNLKYSVDELADKLEVTSRTIYRYLDTFENAGFLVERGVFPRLKKESKYFKNISQLVHFTEEEACIINKVIDDLDDNNRIKNNLKQKLANSYNFKFMPKTVVHKGNAQKVRNLNEAMEKRVQVVLKNYESHGSGVSDRLVEPFDFSVNYLDVWCYEIKSAKCKMFKLSRIQSVEIVQNPWQYEDSHRDFVTDIFRMQIADNRVRVKLKLGMLAHSLLLEEFPLGERDIKQIDENNWLLDTEISNFKGILRFYFGLADDIEIVEGEEFKTAVKDYTSKYLSI